MSSKRLGERDPLSLVTSRLVDDHRDRGGMHLFLNPYSYLQLRQRISLLDAGDVVHVDGIALVAALRLAGIRVRRRSMDMTGIAPEVLGRASHDGLPVAIVGGEHGVADRALRAFESKFGTLNVRYVRHGYFSDDAEMGDVVAELKSVDPRVVIVGAGTPVQEHFLARLKATGWTGEAYTCGGFLHQTAGSESGDYYPGWVNRLQLRWAYRIVREPALWRRYALDYPRFVLAFLEDLRVHRRGEGGLQ